MLPAPCRVPLPQTLFKESASAMSTRVTVANTAAALEEFKAATQDKLTSVTSNLQTLEHNNLKLSECILAFQSVPEAITAQQRIILQQQEAIESLREQVKNTPHEYHSPEALAEELTRMRHQVTLQLQTLHAQTEQTTKTRMMLALLACAVTLILSIGTTILLDANLLPTSALQQALPKLQIPRDVMP
jgi:hypothetical protein